MQIEIIQVGEVVTVPTQSGSYQTVEIAYKREGKVEGKKIVSFNYGEVFETLKDAESGQWYDVKTTKNEKGFWDWVEVKVIDPKDVFFLTGDKKAAPKKVYTPRPAGTAGAKREWVPDEDKQRLIVRQSSLHNAVELLAAFGDCKNQTEATKAALDLGEVFMAWVYQEIEKAPEYATKEEVVASSVAPTPKKRGRPSISSSRGPDLSKVEQEDAEVE